MYTYVHTLSLRITSFFLSLSLFQFSFFVFVSLLRLFFLLCISSVLSSLVQPVIHSVTLLIMFASVWSYLASYSTGRSVLLEPPSIFLIAVYRLPCFSPISTLSLFLSFSLSFCRFLFLSLPVSIPVCLYLRIRFSHLRSNGCRLLLAEERTWFGEFRINL